MVQHSARARWARRVFTSPALLVLLIAPFFGEGLTGSTPPFQLLVPWNLGFMILLYGCGALICREVMHRFGLGMTGLCFLGAAYGVYEEALVDRYWFFPEFWETTGVGTYSVVWHTNVMLAVHLTAFHTAVSICLSVLVVEWAVPRARNRPWVGRRGLALAGAGLAVTPVLYGEFSQRPPIPVLIAAAALLAALVVAAFVLGRRRPARRPDDVRGRAGVGWTVFACAAAHAAATYAIPHTPVPWPLGVLIALAPIVLAVVAVRHLSASGPYGPDGVRAGVGLLSLFIVSDLALGVLIGPDMVLGALATAIAAIVLYRRKARPRAVEPASGATA